MQIDLSKTVKKKYLDIHIKRHGGDTTCEIDVDFSRIEKQFQEAQRKLDLRVMQDMIPYMPMNTGTFVNVTRGMSTAIAGSGKVIAGAPPTGHFLYKGKVAVDPATGTPWAKKGAKKVVTGRSLVFSKSAHPNAGAEWFEVAKKRHGKEWVDLVKKEAGGGKK